ncbi:hypothetical protein PYW07_015402 [Mythimna separata]|uniref:Multiple inositol polyphosphate phosphatase 1 n=1 Tax=Mythimna separata TaxID=271217 RepID=A0AAD7YYP6_MYTSE|nr:hypothetical protein PYW07_015402 [Mythimna separata]
MKFLTSTVLVLFYVKNVLTLECYWNTGCKYKYFGSKTPYEIVRGDIRDSFVKTEECKAVSVWTIMRHGKRNPSQSFAHYIQHILKYKDFIVSSYEIGNSSLCAQDIENLKNWNVDLTMLSNPYVITTEGYQETLRLSNRMMETFPELLKKLPEKDYSFLPGFGRHLEVSARAFIEGLNQNLTLENDTNDYQFVAPYTTCGKYQEEVRRNPDIYREEEEYKKTADYLNTKERIERKLGLNFTFSNQDITAIYDLCRYTWDGISDKPSPWCAIFSAEDLQVLEFIDDLRHYYRNAYGVSQYSKIFGQMPLADLMRKFEEAKNGKGKKIVSYFTHATMMDMILVVLNLYKDANPLVGAHRDMNRKWRTTFLSTFASNMIAVLNKCSKYGQNEYYNVAFYWNEKPLLDLCNRGVCSWQEFEDLFKPFLNATIDFCEFKWANVD